MMPTFSKAFTGQCPTNSCKLDKTKKACFFVPDQNNLLKTNNARNKHRSHRPE